MDIKEKSTELESKSAEEIVRWAMETYRPEIALSTSFGTGSAVLLHMVSQTDPKTPVLFLETGFHFKETLEYRDQLVKLLSLNVRNLRRDVPEKEFFRELGPKPFEKNPDECCRINKVEPLKKELAGLKAWISGVRRSQAHTRKVMQVLEAYDDGVVKVNPLITWSSKDIFDYMKRHNLPEHPLFQKGYTSIGCEPCTRAVLTGEGERAGRWSNIEKTECGIHTFMKQAPKAEIKESKN